MFAQYESEKNRHRGTGRGVYYAIAVVIVMALLGSIDDENAQLRWLK